MVQFPWEGWRLTIQEMLLFWSESEGRESPPPSAQEVRQGTFYLTPGRVICPIVSFRPSPARMRPTRIGAHSLSYSLTIQS